jgi:hypothetical protein
MASTTSLKEQPGTDPSELPETGLEQDHRDSLERPAGRAGKTSRGREGWRTCALEGRAAAAATGLVGASAGAAVGDGSRRREVGVGAGAAVGDGSCGRGVGEAPRRGEATVRLGGGERFHLGSIAH